MADRRPTDRDPGGRATPRRRPGPDQLAGALLVVVGAMLLAPIVIPDSFGPDAVRPTAAPVAAAAVEPSPSPVWTMPPDLARLVGRPEPTGHAGDTVPATPQPPPTSAPPEELTGYVWPMFRGRITTWFQPVDGGFVVVDGERVHDGMDIATFCGDHVLAAHAGTVLYAGRSYEPFLGHDAPTEPFYAQLAKKKLTKRALPIVVVIDDGNGYRSVYAHLSKAQVVVGQVVEAGQRIGLEGATGHATGCHLHYTLIRMDGRYVPIARELVRKWHYPERTRERIDPIRVLSLFDISAPREVPGRPPPALSPGFGPTAPLIEAQRAASTVIEAP